MSNCEFLISIFLAGFTGQGVLIKDPTVWLDRARPALIRSYYEFDVVVIRQTRNVHTFSMSKDHLYACLYYYKDLMKQRERKKKINRERERNKRKEKEKRRESKP